MSTPPHDLLLFSARRDGAPRPPFGPGHAVQVLADLPRVGADERSRAILIVDVGSGSNVDAGRLAAIETYAEVQGRQPDVRAFAALALIGDTANLSSPELVVWLRPDGVWPAWPTAEFAERALAALAQAAERRWRARDDLPRYRRLCRALRVGGYAARADGSAFVWGDREIARMLGCESTEALLTRSPSDLIPRWSWFAGEIRRRPEHAASTVIEVTDGEGHRARTRIAGTLESGSDGIETISGYLHDFSALVDEAESDARQRLADVLDAFGYAYFVSALDGRPIVRSAKDHELLDNPPYDDPRFDSRESWWADPGERIPWRDAVLREGTKTEYPASLRTHTGRLRWIDIDARLLYDASGKPEAIEGIYRDATRRKLTERMSRALSTVGASDAGLKRTSRIICDAITTLFDATACAILLRNAPHARVFAAHVWLDGEHWSGRRAEAAPQNLMFHEKDLPWSPDSVQALQFYEPGGVVEEMVRTLFGDRVNDLHALAVLPLLPGEPDPDDSVPSDKPGAVGGYLFIPLARPLFFPEQGAFDPQFEALLRLCTRQLELAAARDAFDLVRELLGARSAVADAKGREARPAIADLKELDRMLDAARKTLQARIPMEGCSIFRTGIEERQAVLQLATTSGLEGSSEEATYLIGENCGLTGRVAHEQKSLVTFDKTKEPGYAGRHVETMAHTGVTWMGVPLRNRSGRSVGVIRCVNRLTEADRPAVTGFSSLDLQIVDTFAHACALVTELALMQEERSRTLQRINHEIRTPAVGMRNNVLFLKKHYPPPDQKFRAKLSDLELDASVLLNLLQQVDLLSGRTITSAREQRVETNVINIIHKTRYQLVPEMQARGLDPERVEFEPHFMPTLWLPQAAFAQVIFNLFMNAIKYSCADPSQFRIVVQVERGSGVQPYRIHFKDTGIGVEEGHQGSIFDEGYRTPAARAHDARGLGLGLTISRKIIREMGGDLVLVSRTVPTDFLLTLPRDLAHKTRESP